jgi:hypothetical protein
MTMTQNNTHDYLDDLEEKGWNDGYNHANYALAYAPESLYDEPQRPTGLSDHEFGYYLTGYTDGRAQYVDEDYEMDDYAYYEEDED